MALCRSSHCGCAIRSDTLEVSKSGDTFTIELADAYVGAYPVFTFLNVAEMRATITSPQEGMEAWTRADDTKHRYVGADWRVVYRPLTAYSPAVSNMTVGTGGSVTGHYLISDGLLTYFGFIRLGTGFTITAQILFALPFAPVSGASRYAQLANFYDSSAGTMYPFAAEIFGSSIAPYVQSDSGGHSFTPTTVNPVAMAANDELWLSGSYPVAPVSA